MKTPSVIGNGKVPAGIPESEIADGLNATGTEQARSQMILVGGTSHTGKSSVGHYLAQQLGWEYAATDKLARHPGRPWRNDGASIPVHVAEHYRSLDSSALLQSVLAHYQANIFPLVMQLIEARNLGGARPGLVLEGSAVLPGLRPLIGRHGPSFVWLSASADTLTHRIRAESKYTRRNPAERLIIDRFVARTIAFDHALHAELEAGCFACIDTSTARGAEQVANEVALLAGISLPLPIAPPLGSSLLEP